MKFLIILISFLWTFKGRDLKLKQLKNYKVSIIHSENKTILRGFPSEEGLSTAWFFLPENIRINSSDTLIIKLKVNANTLRLRYFLLSEDKRIYKLGIKFIPATGKWEELKIPLDNLKNFYSSNFPWALVPDKKIPLYIFFENKAAGNFEIEIEHIKLKTTGSKK